MEALSRLSELSCGLARFPPAEELRRTLTERDETITRLEHARQQQEEWHSKMSHDMEQLQQLVSEAQQGAQYLSSVKQRVRAAAAPAREESARLADEMGAAAVGIQTAGRRRASILERQRRATEREAEQEWRRRFVAATRLQSAFRGVSSRRGLHLWRVTLAAAAAAAAMAREVEVQVQLQLQAQAETEKAEAEAKAKAGAEAEAKMLAEAAAEAAKAVAEVAEAVAEAMSQAETIQEEGVLKEREGAATWIQAQARGLLQRRAVRDFQQAAVDEALFGGTDSLASVDSGLEHEIEVPPEAAWPQGLQGLVSMATLCGREQPPPPGCALEHDARRLLLTSDALWHRTESPTAGEVPCRIELAQLKSCQLAESGELVLVSEGAVRKCHVLSNGPDPSVSMQDWHGRIDYQLRVVIRYPTQRRSL